MVCAVLSAVYDYDTDWVKTEHPESSLTFQELDRLLDDHPNRDEAITIAQTLFRLDWDGRLSADGLERGSYALHFYWLVIESRWMSAYTADEIKLFGRKLQIVDDLYDLEKDRHSGDKNCFHIGKSWRYAREGREFLESDFFHALEENSPIYRLIREHCQKKLDHMHL